MATSALTLSRPQRDSCDQFAEELPGGQFNTIVPVKFLSANVANNNFVMSFRTATGPNGGIGTNYAVEALSAISSTNWVTVSNLTGNGTTKTVAIPFSPFSNKFFRLRVP